MKIIELKNSIKIVNFKLVIKRCISFLPFVFVFIASLFQPKDPDLGWHLRYGEYFFKHHQILRDNIFSTMMPNYHWANGSWGTDLITYLIYNHFGFLGLTIASALIVMLTFFFFSKAAKLNFLQQSIFFPVLVYLTYSMNNNSFRGQQITLLFLGILFFILSKYKPQSRIFILIPPLFLTWCNLHEEGFLGLTLLGLWTVFTLTRNILQNYNQHQKITDIDIIHLPIILLLSIFATFINPFGLKIHLVALSHLGSPLLGNVNEYIPFAIYSIHWWSLIILTVLVLLGILYLFFQKKLLKNMPLWGIILILLLASFFIRRYVWPGYYLSFLFLGITMQEIKHYFKKYYLVLGLIISIISILYISYLKMPFDQFTNMSWQDYCRIQSVPCSLNSASYLKNHKLTKNLLTFYDWGGWLIWNYPEIKPSIDGRMHVWQDKNGYSATIEYNKYWSNAKSVDKSNFDVVYLPQEQSPIYMKLSDLIKQGGWESVYQDNNSVIAVRIKK
jgi:hypothetical protein